MNTAEYVVHTEALDQAACWQHLGSAHVGRVAFVDHDGPSALPVNCAVHRHQVVFRTARDTALYARSSGATVAFEADDTDVIAEAGWSVLVRGHLWEVTDPAELAALHELPLHPWVEGERDVWLTIVPTAITGRMTSRSRVRPHGPGVSLIPPD